MDVVAATHPRETYTLMTAFHTPPHAYSSHISQITGLAVGHSNADTTNSIALVKYRFSFRKRTCRIQIIKLFQRACYNQ